MSSTRTQNPHRQPLGHDLAEHQRQRHLVLGQPQPQLQEGRRNLEGNGQPRLRRPADDGQAARPGPHLDRQADAGRLQSPQGPPGSRQRRRVKPTGRAAARPLLSINLHGVPEMTTVVIAIARPKFPLGQIVITANAQATLDPADVQQGLAATPAATGATSRPRTSS